MASLDDEIKIGAREAKQKMLAESVRSLNKDRTLIALQLTPEEPLEPEVKESLGTIDAVFEAYKPQVEIDFENESGEQHTEAVLFKNLADFTPGGISAQSEFLKNLQLERDFIGDLIKQLNANKTLRKLLENPETKAAFISALDAMINEIPE